MDCSRIIFSGHALRRMFERSIGTNDVLKVLSSGEVIANYSDDQPYPSCLMLGFVARRPIHVVVSTESKTGICHIITAYDPAPELWDKDFKKRR